MPEGTDHEPSRMSSAFRLSSKRAFAVFAAARPLLQSFRRVDAPLPSSHSLHRTFNKTSPGTVLRKRRRRGVSRTCHRKQNFLPGDSDIAKKLDDFQQLVNARPDQTDKLVGELQEWLRGIQQHSSLHLAALQHLLTCIDLYNWANQNDDTLERSKDKTRWLEVQVARYRNRFANEVCKIKGGNSDHLGLVVLPLMTAKGLKFANLQRATEKEEDETIRQLAAMARPALENTLKELGRSEFWAPNPVSFVGWFLDKPVEQLGNICKALCLSELSDQDYHPSPTIQHQHQIRTSVSINEINTLAIFAPQTEHVSSPAITEIRDVTERGAADADVSTTKDTGGCEGPRSDVEEPQQPSPNPTAPSEPQEDIDMTTKDTGPGAAREPQMQGLTPGQLPGLSPSWVAGTFNLQGAYNNSIDHGCDAESCVPQPILGVPALTQIPNPRLQEATGRETGLQQVLGLAAPSPGNWPLDGDGDVAGQQVAQTLLQLRHPQASESSTESISLPPSDAQETLQWYRDGFPQNPDLFDVEIDDLPSLHMFDIPSYTSNT
ncbi:hypothetical protein NCS52_01519400 [Fusarium sp. LHS14.1]|nr:hypothetical protein NCS52_01519400 [Fusarium sp. LHS14.1]